MDELPDVIGCPLDEALGICKALGFDVEIMVARPVRAIPEERSRVVRFNVVSKNKGVVTVMFEDIGRGGG
jgi:hypothetical protein